MAIEIVDFPIKNGGSFHCYVNVHQRVSTNIGLPEGNPIFPRLPIFTPSSMVLQCPTDVFPILFPMGFFGGCLLFGAWDLNSGK